MELLVLFAAGIAAFAWWVSRPHTVVTFSAGDASLDRGALPPGLLGDLKDVAKGLPPEARGRLGIQGQGDTLKLELKGLPEFVEQRVRNVVLLRRRQIRKP